ncbi:MAG: peptide chain release factor N(5)-glutamine methyltransferase [Deltaproteobacteria bacterium]|nr:peptide chain release factor N(5)-glutamine methyltransferase [Deltaproteobacteria bacterium]
MTKKTWIIKDLLAVSIDFLKSKNIESPRLSAEILLACQLKTDRLKLYLEHDQPVGEKDLTQYRAMIKRLMEGEPVQYITGVQEFWSMDLFVNSEVLIPRPETEILVEQALRIYHEEYMNKPGDVSILDIGTGSGAIAIAVASEIENAKITAVDISAKALETAKLNAATHGMENRINFYKGNLLETLNKSYQSFDIILSNPPYVTKKEYELLPKKIKDFEPRLALESGEDGLFHIREILEKAPDFLNQGGWLILEMDPIQIKHVIQIIENSNKYTSSQVIKDYSNRERVVIARKK